MAKQSGLGDNLYVGGYNLSGDIGSLGGISGGNSPLGVTGINSSGEERTGGKRSGAIEFSSFFNDAAGRAHPTLSALPTTRVQVMYLRGTTIGNAGAAMIGRQVGYDGTLSDSGELTFAVSAQSDGYGLEWGRQHTDGMRTDTGATEGNGVQHADGATAYGLQAYLQVLSFAGTDATIKLQSSSDDGGVDAYADVTGGGFTEITSAPFVERIASAVDLAVEEYLRVVTVTTGGFTELTFAVLVVRNLATPAF